MATIRMSLPSNSCRLPNRALQMRTALASMASKTGVNSPGELEMTPKTSEVAVCCSQRLAQFVQQARVLDGDDCLGGKIL